MLDWGDVHTTTTMTWHIHKTYY